MKQSEFLEIIELNKKKRRPSLETLVEGRNIDFWNKRLRITITYKVDSAGTRTLFASQYYLHFSEVEIEGNHYVFDPNDTTLYSFSYNFKEPGYYTVYITLRNDFSSTQTCYSLLPYATLITQMSFPQGIKSIPTSLLSNVASSIGPLDSNNLSITIPSSVKEIKLYAFSGCYAMKKVIIPKGVICNNGCFNGVYTKDYEFRGTYVDENTTLYGYNLISGTSYLKKLVLDCGNKTIFNFSYYSNLEEAYLSGNITCIGDSCFSTDSKLKTLEITDNVTWIGSGAFANCEKLSNLILPKKLTHIGQDAFKYCKSISKIVIPDTVEEIGENAFKGCIILRDNFINNSQLDEVENNYWGATIIDYDIDGLLINDNVVIGYRGDKENIAIPDFVISIGSEAFRENNTIKTVTIPNSVTSIDDLAFYLCQNLTGIIIPDSVTSISDYAFAYCNNFRFVTIGSSIQTIGNNAFKSNYIVESRFINNSDLDEESNNYWGAIILDSDEDGFLIKDHALLKYVGTENIIQIPDGVTTIGNGSDAIIIPYYNPEKSIIIPDSVTWIRYNAFYSETLDSIEFGSGIQTIDNHAFYYTRLNSIVIDDIATWCNITFSDATANPLYENNSLAARNIFDKNGNRITSITIPENITVINGYAFYKWRIPVIIPKSVQLLKSNSFYLFAGNIVFDGFSGTIENNAFSSVLNSVKVIVTDMESWCNINFSSNNANPTSSLLKIYSDNDTEITDLIIPTTISLIKQYAFSRCSYITSVVIPNTVTSIGQQVFYGCSKLNTITSLNTTAPTIYNNTFSNIKTGGTLRIPVGSTGYDVWMGTGNYYLGKYNWTKVEQ